MGTRQLPLILPSSLANVTFGGRTQGAMTHTFELGRDFCTMHLATSEFHHPMFTRSEVIVLTNKQTDAAVNIQRSSLYATTLGKHNRGMCKLFFLFCTPHACTYVFIEDTPDDVQAVHGILYTCYIRSVLQPRTTNSIVAITNPTDGKSIKNKMLR